MQGASAAELAGVRDAAAGCAAEFVRFPDQFQFDLLESDPLRQLQRDPEHAQLYRLLTILLTSADVRVRVGCIAKSCITCTPCPSIPHCYVGTFVSLYPTEFFVHTY